MCKCSKQSLLTVKSLDDPREKKVFGIISKQAMNFTAIKNEAGFHQEITSRIIKRLRDKVMVRKTDGLYDLCCNGSEIKLK